MVISRELLGLARFKLAGKLPCFPIRKKNRVFHGQVQNLLFRVDVNRQKRHRRRHAKIALLIQLRRKEKASKNNRFLIQLRRKMSKERKKTHSPRFSSSKSMNDWELASQQLLRVEGLDSLHAISEIFRWV
jgi:hypothetical protein